MGRTGQARRIRRRSGDTPSGATAERVFEVYPPVLDKRRVRLLRQVGDELSRNRILYAMAIPGILFVVLFAYLPMVGMIVAFKDFSPRLGIFGSPWIGLKNFDFIIRSQTIGRVIRNTLVLNFTFLIVGKIAAVALALSLNEVQSRWFKKVTQSVLILPHFISFMVVSLLVYSLFSTNYGVVNHALSGMGLETVSWYSNPTPWPFILLGTSLWKGVGWGSIIFLAVLSGINPELYEAIEIDGGNRWHKTRYISIPHLLPVITILLLLDLGHVLNSDFGLFYGIIGDNALLFSTTDVLDTWVFRALRVMGDVGMSSAAGFFKSVVGFLMVLGTNAIARRHQEEGALF